MDIAPFAALRYADARAGEIDRCVSLPYDQFGDAGRDERYRRHPHNVVRLIKPRAEQASAHEAARATLQAWRRDGVLVQDPEPALYPYRQRFTAPGGAAQHERWSFIARLELTPFDSGPTRPHERTYPDTVGERSHLRHVVGADLGLILVVYDDPSGEIDARVQAAGAHEPLFEARDESGTANALWYGSGVPELADLPARLAAARGFIADGHHRYTAALAHWQGRGAATGDPAGWVMAALVSASSPGLRILPTHRLTEAGPGERDIAAWRAAGLEVRGLATGADPEAAAAAAAGALARQAADHAVVVLSRDGRGLTATLASAPRGSLVNAPWPPDVPASWRALDVAVLHSLMLDPWLADVLHSQKEDHGALGYCNDLLESARRVASGERAAAFLINPLTVVQVQDVVAAGDVLPPKSTNFHPKVIAGLTIHAFGDNGAS
jgi:uncharacterized protein (DUF1015 family)